MKIALERHHVTKTQQRASSWLPWNLRCQSSTFKTFEGPAYAFSHFSHVILLSNANSEIPREIIRNFGSIVFYVPENPQKHPETQNWLFPRELGSSEFNLHIWFTHHKSVTTTLPFELGNYQRLSIMFKKLKKHWLKGQTTWYPTCWPLRPFGGLGSRYCIFLDRVLQEQINVNLSKTLYICISSVLYGKN